MRIRRLTLVNQIGKIEWEFTKEHREKLEKLASQEDLRFAEHVILRFLMLALATLVTEQPERKVEYRKVLEKLLDQFNDQLLDIVKQNPS